MKEYEYIVLAIDEFMSHFVTKTICLENYYDEDYAEDFKSIFKMFCELRDEYRNIYNQSDIKPIDIAKIKAEFRFKREEILNDFILKMESIEKTIDFKEKVKEYFNDIGKEDVETLEMQIMVYPYLISVLRKNEESRSNNG